MIQFGKYGAKEERGETKKKNQNEFYDAHKIFLAMQKEIYNDNASTSHLTTQKKKPRISHSSLIAHHLIKKKPSSLKSLWV